MKIFITIILYFLLLAFLVLMILFGIDMEVARREYNHKIETNDRTWITDCIIEYPCIHYNKLLKENIL